MSNPKIVLIIFLDIIEKNINFTFIKDFETGHGNVDNIVIGPTGIWILEVKSHRGNITFNGEILLRYNKPLEKNFLVQAYAESMAVRNVLYTKLGLQIDVQPVVVFSSKWVKIRLGQKRYRGVYVIQKRWLCNLITNTNNQTLTNEIMLKIKEVLIV